MSSRQAPSLIDITTCQLCGAESSSLMFEDDGYEVRRCDSCGFVWVTPRHCDDTIHEVYGEDYWNSDSPKTKGYADYASEEALYLKTFRRRLRFVESHCPKNARILDVGCAAGYFLRVMREAGHDVYGVELSAPIANEAIHHLGADRVHVGTLDSVPNDDRYARGSFDLVTMWDVIEHVPDPQQLLREARAMLKPNGRLIIETQNVDSRFARRLGPRWHHFKHEEHIYHFNPSTVRDVLAQAGFETLVLTSRYGGKYVSFGFIAERAARLNKLASFALKPLNLMRRANLYVNLRDEMVLVARPTADTPAGNGVPST